MDGQPPNPQQTVHEILNAWPATVNVFNNLKTACVGCYLARFCSLADVAITYDLPTGELMQKLCEAIEDLHIITTGDNHEETKY